MAERAGGIMGYRSTSRVSLLLLAFTVMLAFATLVVGFSVKANAQEISSPTIQSDKADYAPGETVVLTGSNWQPGESVNISVNDDEGKTWDRNVDVTADDSGAIRDEFQLPDWFVAQYSVTATGSSGSAATTSFTDSPAADVFIDSTTPSVIGSAGSSAIQWHADLKANDGNSTGAFSVRVGGTSCTTGTQIASGAYTVSNQSKTTNVAASSLSEGANTIRVCVTFTDHGASHVASATTTVTKDTTAPTVTIVSTNPSTLGATGSSTITWKANENGAFRVKVGGSNCLSGGQVVSTGTYSTAGLETTSTVDASDLGNGSNTVRICLTDTSGNEGSATTTITKNAVQSTSVGSITASTSTYGGTTTLSATVSPAGAPGSVAFYVNGSTTAAAGTVSYNSSTGVATLSDYTHGLNASTTPYSVKAVFTSSSPSYSNSEATNSSALTVNKKAITITPGSGQSKVYGSSDPTSLTFANSPALESGDSFNGKLGRASGENVGNYPINLGNLSAGSNYNLNLSATPVNFAITPKSVTGSFTAANKVYDGNTGATISGRSLAGKVGSDDVTLSSGSATFGDKNVGTGKTVNGTGFTLSGTAASNYTLASSNLATTADITKKSLTGNFTAQNKPYDGNRNATITGSSLAAGGVVGTDAVTLNGSGASALFDTKDVGTGKTVTASGFTLSGADAGNYSLSMNTASADITKKALTGSFTASNKTYDGNRTATITGGSLSGVVGTEDVSLDRSSASALFDTRDVGTGKTVTGSGFGLSGAAKDNYNLDSVSNTTANITPKTVTGSFTAKNKTYDGNTSAEVLNKSLASGDVIGSDAVTLDVTNAQFANKNVGNGKTVSATLGLSGGQAGNYILSSTTANTTANIMPKSITGSFTAANKVYDGNTDAAASNRSLSGAISTDIVSLTGGTASFSDKNVGSNKPVTLSGASLSGDDAGNYDLTSVDTATADITKAALTVTADNKSKNYGDANPLFTGTLTGVQGNDAITKSYSTTATQQSPVGTYDIVADVSGTQAVLDNYTITKTNGTLTVDEAPLTIKADDASKVYGDDNPAFTGSIVSGLKNNDSLSVSASSAATQSSPVGTYAIVPVLNGAAKDNYDVTAQNGTLTVTRAPLTVKADNDSREYGAANPTFSATITGFKLTDTRQNSVTGSPDFSTGATQSSPVGTYAITPSAGTLSADNYSFSFQNGTLSVTARPITVSADAQSKIYGQSDPALTYKVTTGSLVGNDAFSGHLDRAAGEDAGTYAINKGTLTAGGNYDLTFNGANLTITQRPITVTADAKSKTYGDDDPALTYKIGGRGLASGDSFSGNLSRELGEDVGSYNITQGSLSLGTKAGNYDLTFVGAKLSIGQRAITVTADAKSKIYGDADPALTYKITSGSLASDDGFTGTLTRQTGETVAGGPYAIQKGTLSAGSNYDLTFVGSSLTIKPKLLTGSFTAKDKVYDGDASATIDTSSLDGVINGDQVSLNGDSATFEDKNVGTDKAVTVTTGALSGLDAGNYKLAAGPWTATASITRALLTISAVSQTKVYDGTIASSGTPTVSGLKNGDTVTGLSQAFQSEDAMGANGSTLVVTGYTVNDGNSGANYSVTTQTASGTITKATLTVEPNPKTASRHYSDPNPSFSPSYAGFVNSETDAVLGTKPTCSSVATTSSGPGSYAITCSGGVDNNYSFSYRAGTLTVTKENASAEFSGATYYSTPTAGGSVNVTLTAVITDDDTDGSRGDIRNATVSFVNRDATGEPAFTKCSNLPVGLVTTGDTTVGTATCNTTLTAGTSTTLANLYTVGTVVNNYYTRNDSLDDTVVTVAQSVAGSITGGGFLKNELSGGQYAGDTGQKTNFGFNVRLDKNGSPKGQINTIVRRGGRVYQIKGNAMTSLTTKVCPTGAASATCPGTATFNGKASIQDITNPLAPISVDGNASLQVRMTDNGEPGSSDTIGITVWNKNGGLWFSSRWVSPNTVQQLLGGGNLVVR